MMQERHPEVTRELVRRLDAGDEASCFGAAATPARNLVSTHGFETPSWNALVDGACPPPREPDDHERGVQTSVWQHEASSRVELQYRELQFARSVAR